MAVAKDGTGATKTGSGVNSLAVTGVSTAGANELLVLFAGGDAGSATTGDVSSVTGGGLTWTKLLTANGTNLGNAGHGFSSIWYAFASSQLTNQTITVNFNATSVCWAYVQPFSGTDITGGAGAIGANTRAGTTTGAPSASITTTRDASWVWGTIWDWSNNVTPTMGATQTQQAIFNDVAGGDSGWTQSQTSTTPTSGSSVTINDTSPTTDNWMMVVVEILPPTASFAPDEDFSPRLAQTPFDNSVTVWQ